MGFEEPSEGSIRFSLGAAFGGLSVFAARELPHDPSVVAWEPVHVLADCSKAPRLAVLPVLLEERSQGRLA